MTDTEKAALCARIDELCAENERLRQELDAVKCAACEAMLDCDECLRADASQKERKGLAYDNARLRELCWRMRTYMAGVVEHNGYQIMTTGYTMLGGRIKECDEAMQALGIEVD